MTGPGKTDDDGAIEVAPKDLGKPWQCATGEKHLFRVRSQVVHWLEIEDVLFHFDSAVLMPDAESQDEPGTVDQERIAGLAVLRAAYMQAGDNPQQKLLIAGHTDTSGDAAYNEKLSKWRAADVLHVLLGEKDPWVALAKEHSKPDDVKHILRWVARWKNWTCYTDATGDVMDAGTKNAVKAFQRDFSAFEGGHAIDVDGVVGTQTWGAFFDLYMLRLAELCTTDLAGLGALRGKLQWLYGDRKSIGCGEYHPIDMPGKDDVKSQKNRRVELLFYDPGEEPVSKPGELCHSGGQAASGKCPVYDPNTFTYVHLRPRQLHFTKVDDHFAPLAETLDIGYVIEGLDDQEVTLEISSPHYDSNPIYKRALTAGEKSDGAHTLAWDGKANCAGGALVDLPIHPLLSPYTVKLSDGGKHTDETTFKVLYHSLELRQGAFTPDEAEPPKSDERAWVQYKLNELGYYGGPVGKDTDSYLDRAIVRYKANHKAMHELDYAKYDATITDALKQALASGDNRRVFLEGEALTDAGKEARIFVEALTYESTTEFGESKADKEKVRLNRPLLPVEAALFLRSKTDAKTAVPTAVGPARVNWRFSDPDEDLTKQPASTVAQPSKTRDFVKKCLELESGRDGTNGDNCHKSFLGIRDTADQDGFAPVLLGDFLVPYTVEKDAGQKLVFSKACTDATKYPKRVGRAGCYFRPSNVAGDDYRIKAELDFTGLPNQAALESFHGITDASRRPTVESGVLRVWRKARVALAVTWPPRTNSHQWAEIAREFTTAYLEMDVAGITTKKISEVLTEKQYQQIVADHTDHKKKDVSLLDDALVGVDLPKQGSMNAADYRTALSTFTSDNYWKKIRYALREQLSANIRKEYPTGFVVVEFLTHRPVTVRKAPPGDNSVAVADYVTWSFSIGLPDSTIFADQKDPDKVYYVVAHEMGHNFWLKHWEHAGGSRPDDHDQEDHNCTMSYSSSGCAHAHHRPGSYTPHFCGKCVLKLRGWDIEHADIPDDST